MAPPNRPCFAAASPLTPSPPSTPRPTFRCSLQPIDRPPLSPTAVNLIRQQALNPIFNPALLADPLSTTLSQLQNQIPPLFLHSSHLPEHTPLQNKHALDLIAAHSNQAVAAARAYVVRTHRGIDQPGGALWPEYRAQACWRDLSAFARVAGYLTISPDALSEQGLNIMNQLYREMQVPLDALQTGLSCTTEYLVNQALLVHDASVAHIIRQAFHQLLVQLRNF